MIVATKLDAVGTLPMERLRPDGLFFGGGFKQEWVSGEGNGVEFVMCVGAGLGNPFADLLVTFPDGTQVHEYLDSTSFVEEWVNAIVEERA